MQSITLQDLQYSYFAVIFVVLMCDEAKESLAIVLITSRYHFDDIVTAHRKEVLISFWVLCLRSLHSLVLRTAFLYLGPLIQGKRCCNPKSEKWKNAKSGLVPMSRWEKT